MNVLPGQVKIVLSAELGPGRWHRLHVHGLADGEPPSPRGRRDAGSAREQGTAGSRPPSPPGRRNFITVVSVDLRRASVTSSRPSVEPVGPYPRSPGRSSPRVAASPSVQKDSRGGGIALGVPAVPSSPVPEEQVRGVGGFRPPVPHGAPMPVEIRLHRVPDAAVRRRDDPDGVRHGDVRVAEVAQGVAGEQSRPSSVAHGPARPRCSRPPG